MREYYFHLEMWERVIHFMNSVRRNTFKEIIKKRDISKSLLGLLPSSQGNIFKDVLGNKAPHACQ